MQCGCGMDKYLHVCLYRAFGRTGLQPCSNAAANAADRKQKDNNSHQRRMGKKNLDEAGSENREAEWRSHGIQFQFNRPFSKRGFYYTISSP